MAPAPRPATRPLLLLLLLLAFLVALPGGTSGAASREGPPRDARVAFGNGLVGGVVAADGEEHVFRQGDGQGVGELAWSSDGATIALVESEVYGSGPLRLLDPEDGSTSDVLIAPARNPAWSEAGLLAAIQDDAVAVIIPRRRDLGIDLAEVPSSPQHPLKNLRWRPGSNEWTVVGVDGPNGEDIFIGPPLRFDGPTNLTGAAVRVSAFEWLPSGDAVAVVGRSGEDPTGPPALFIVGRDGQVRRVAGLPSDRLLGISPDGRQLALEVPTHAPEARSTRVELVDVATGASRTLTDDFAVVHDVVVEVEWMPDGRSLLVSAVQYDSGSDNLGYVTLIDATTGVEEAVQPLAPDAGIFALNASADILVDVDTSSVSRLAGGSRFGTAAAIAADSRPAARTVVLARGDEYADALAGAPLAGLLDAPLLLTGRDELADETSARLFEEGEEGAVVERIVILGGPAAISSSLVDRLEDDGFEVERVAGATRFETAVAVRDRVVALGGDADAAYVAQGRDADPGRGWPDAVAIAPLAAAQGRPILLTDTGSLPDATREALTDETITVVGGTAVVSETVRAELADASGQTVERLSGPDRFATSAVVARAALDQGLLTEEVWLATGAAFPDALAAGPAAAASRGVVLLVAGEELVPEAVTLLGEHPGARRIVAVGDAGVVAPPLAVRAAALALR